MKVGLLCHAWREDVVPSLVDCIRFFFHPFLLRLGSWFMILEQVVVSFFAFHVCDGAGGRSNFVSNMNINMVTTNDHLKGKQWRQAAMWWG